MKRQIIILILMLGINLIAIGQNATSKAAYSRLVRNADSLYFIGDCKRAIDSLKIASTLIKKEFYSQTRIKEIETCMAIADSVKTTCPCKNKPTIIHFSNQEISNFAKTLDRIDSALLVKDYQLAQTLISNTDCFKLREDYGKRINILRVEINYNKNITEADEALSKKDYSNAITKYQEALRYKPNDASVTQKIHEINTIVKNQKEFADLVAQGDKHITDKNYKAALVYYEKAQIIFPNDEALKTKIENAKQNIKD